MSSRRISHILSALLGAALLLPANGLGVDTLGLRLGSLEGQGWSADGIELHLNLQASEEIGFRVRVAEIRVAELSDPLRDLEIRCPSGRLDGSRLACEEGQLRLMHPLLEKPELGVSFAWDKASDSFELQLRKIAAAGGNTLIAVRGDRRGWDLSLDGRSLQPEKLKAALGPLGLGQPPWTLQGRLDLKLRAAGSRAGVESLGWNGRLKGIGFAGPDGSYVGESLAGDWNGELRARRASWVGSSSLRLSEGEMLTPFFYLAAKPHAVSLSAEIGFSVAGQQLELKNIKYRQRGALGIDAQAELALTDEAPLRHLDLRSTHIPLQALYQYHLQPVLAEGVAANLETAGDLSVNLSYRAAGASRLEVGLQDVHLDGVETPESAGAGAPESSTVRPFGLYGLNGRVVWIDGADPQVSELRWGGGHLLEVIHLGPSSVKLQIGPQGLTLLKEAEIPVLDGSLLVSSFVLARRGDATERVTFEGVLTPVSMQSISEALGWPPLSGKLSGVIPGVSLEAGVLEVEGNLLIRAFDGEVLVRNLRMEDPLGIWPVVTADLEVRNLDLEALTGAFAFGKITGRLEGKIEDLRLENWSPMAFDARFSTPETDRSVHRISQRAVDNISDLGGVGVSGALSRSFLRYFEEFGYKRLGISCRLRNGVCEMGGVAPAGDGYYLVEGGGIPRIDIVGFTRRTDWMRLVGQLKEIAAGSAGTPVIE